MPRPTSSDVHVSRPLTNISVAFIQDQSKFIADRVFPTVQVDKQADRYFVYDKADFFRSEAAERAPSTESAGSGFELDNTPNYYAKVYANHKDVDDQVRSNSDSPLNPDRDATTFVTQQLMLLKEKRWIANYFGTGIWTTDKTGGVDFTQWDNAAATPIEDIDDFKNDIARTTGFKPNTLVLGPEAWTAFKNNPNVQERIKFTQRGIVTAELAAALLELDRVLIPEGVENTAPVGAAEATDFLFGKQALLCYAAPNPGIMIPSAGYTFSWSGLVGSNGSGMRIKKFRMEELASDRIEGEMAFDQKLVSADLGLFLDLVVA